MSRYHEFKKMIFDAIENGELDVEEIQEIATDASVAVYGKKLTIMTKPDVKTKASFAA